MTSQAFQTTKFQGIPNQEHKHVSMLFDVGALMESEKMPCKPLNGIKGQSKSNISFVKSFQTTHWLSTFIVFAICYSQTKPRQQWAVHLRAQCIKPLSSRNNDNQSGFGFKTEWLNASLCDHMSLRPAGILRGAEWQSMPETTPYSHSHPARWLREHTC